MQPETHVRITATVNGEDVKAEVPVRLNLVDFLRHNIGLTGAHIGCEAGACGACTVLVNGRLTRGCLMLAVQADGDRGCRREWPDCAVARSLSSLECTAVWLLHTGHAAYGCRIVASEPKAESG